MSVDRQLGGVKREIIGEDQERRSDEKQVLLEAAASSTLDCVKVQFYFPSCRARAFSNFFENVHYAAERFSASS